MKLEVKNLAKISYLNAKIDGITVIAGENNTGKSTVGKVLFALFNSTVNLEKRVMAYRKSRIVDILNNGIENTLSLSSEWMYQNFAKSRRLIKKVADRIFDESISNIDKEEIYLIVAEFYEDIGLFKDSDLAMNITLEVTEQIIKMFEVEDKVVFNSLIEKYFLGTFHDQINNIYRPDTEALVDLVIHDSQHLKISFIQEKCEIKQMDFRTIHNAVYIDSPFSIDKLNDNPDYGNYLEAFLMEKLLEEREANLFEEIENLNKLQEIIKLLDGVCEGKVIKNEKNEYVVRYQNESLNPRNLSTGIKAFTIIKMLLESGKIKEKDVLILDEPEIHLHPQWQLVYAEIIVLLQKYFDLSIVITTHSPYFLDAIETYSVKHGIGRKVNYYLSECDENGAEFKDVTENLELVYEKLAKPLDQLDSIRY